MRGELPARKPKQDDSWIILVVIIIILSVLVFAESQTFEWGINL